MAQTEKEAYLTLIAAQDPQIRTLLDQGFALVTNAFKADAAPAGMKARTDRAPMRRLHQAGYQVEVSAAYDAMKADPLRAVSSAQVRASFEPKRSVAKKRK